MGEFLAELTGTNSAGDKVQLAIYLEYSNICGVPALQVGESIGWMTFDYVEQYRNETCFTFPSAPPSTSSPISSAPPTSQMPTVAPSSIPSTVPSLIPSTAPPSIPSTAPSSIPSTTPSYVPSSSPTRCPEGKGKGRVPKGKGGK